MTDRRVGCSHFPSRVGGNSIHIRSVPRSLTVPTLRYSRPPTPTVNHGDSPPLANSSLAGRCLSGRIHEVTRRQTREAHASSLHGDDTLVTLNRDGFVSTGGLTHTPRHIRLANAPHLTTEHMEALAVLLTHGVHSKAARLLRGVSGVASLPSTIRHSDPIALAPQIHHY